MAAKCGVRGGGYFSEKRGAYIVAWIDMSQVDGGATECTEGHDIGDGCVVFVQEAQ